MSGNTGVDENLIPGVQTIIDGLPQVAPSGEIPGLPPEWSTPSKEGDDKTKGEIDDTKDTGDKVKDGAKKLHDKDKEGKDALDGIDGKTDLSSDGKSPSEGTPKVYPSSNQTPQQSMPQSQPQQQSMPQMSMPQTPQASMPQVSVPKDTFSKLAGNYNPSSSKSHDSDSKGKFSDPNGVNKGKLDASEVDLNKKGYGKLSLSELRAVMDKGLDANGITDEKARAQWKKVLEYMAIKESGLNADAVNTSDSNAHGATAADGNPFNCSRGIWQTIPTTFAAHHVSGTSSAIYDPVSSCAASISYSMSRYNIPKEGGAALERFYQARGGGGGNYTGY